MADALDPARVAVAVELVAASTELRAQAAKLADVLRTAGVDRAWLEPTMGAAARQALAVSTAIRMGVLPWGS